MEILYHFYADDGQLYIVFELPTEDNPDTITIAKARIEACICEMREWLAIHMLLCNDDKTEVLLFDSRHKEPIDFPGLKIGSEEISPSPNARNIGLVMDSGLTLTTHVNGVVSAAFFHLRNIASINDHLTQEAAQTLVHAYVTNKLDYCNSVLYGLPDYLIEKLQYVQNSAARLLTVTRKFDHITPVLIQLHWLPVKYRIDFKILLLTFKALHKLAPEYLSDLLTVYKSSHSLRSLAHDNLLLVESKTRLKSYGDRAFSNAAPKLWNRLPRDIRHSKSLNSFKRALKTHLFKMAFNT
jgi:hypothetical protein